MKAVPARNLAFYVWEMEQHISTALESYRF